MVKIAVVGGTGGVSFAIVDAHKGQTQNEFLLSSREVLASKPPIKPSDNILKNKT